MPCLVAWLGVKHMQKHTAVYSKSFKQLVQTKTTMHALVSDKTQDSMFVQDKVWWKAVPRAALAVCSPPKLGFSGEWGVMENHTPASY